MTAAARPMMGIVIKAPFVLLAAEGIKGWETRGYTPDPARLAEGERLALIAGRNVFTYDQAPEAWDRLAELDHLGRLTGEEIASAVGVLGPDCWRWPLGHVVAAPVYGGSVPILSTVDDRHPHRRYIIADPVPPQRLTYHDRRRVGLNPVGIADQWHLGTWTPGRRAWPLTGATVLERPVPCPAKQPDGSRISMQSMFPLPAHVAAAVTAQIGLDS